MELGIIAALILALDIYAIYSILQEPWSGAKKLVWIVIILIFQVFGMLAYFLFFRERKA